MTRPFRRVLVANRGEIAVRVIRACQELDVTAIAVFSEADRAALHTRVADEAHPIGPPPAAESYLHVERILGVARRTQADAIHPGYGFLAENADFADACALAGLAFIGPSPSAMRLVADKGAARRLAAQHGVPTVPGYDGPDQDHRALLGRANEIGFPLLIKATAGGGGRGMRIVQDAGAFPEALDAARREARAAFGDDAVILERYLTSSRHVEVQILGDRHGAIVHLGERDCSVQRRHQKVIEESPSPAVGPELRERLGAAAVRVARAAGYWNAGTCEFLLDQAGALYFLEMNARLQVEHPVTEQVTGLDLVHRQLEIAAGAPLGLVQADVALRGHAVECRLYAEDPAHDFLPQAGRLERFAPPLGPGLRHDVGFAAGDRVTTSYDPMLAKLIAWGEDRPSALARARRAVERYVVSGVTTNLPLLAWVLDHPTFAAGAATTDFLTREWRPAPPAAPPPRSFAAAAAFELDARSDPGAVSGSGSTPLGEHPWGTIGPWRVLDQGIILTYDVEGTRQTVVIDRAAAPGAAPRAGGDAPSAAADAWSIAVGGETYGASVGPDGVVTLEHGDARRVMRVAHQDDCLAVSDTSAAGSAAAPSYTVRRARPPQAEAAAGRAGSGGDGHVAAPMPGRVVKLAVRERDAVREHQPLLVLEAMKIEHTVTAPRNGVVGTVHCQEGDTVESGALLVTIENIEA